VANAISYPLKNALLNVVKAGRLRWIGLWLPGISFGRQDQQRETRPFRIRWGWTLLLAVVLVLVMGEYGPAAPAIPALP
jgi:hypothetical protein